MLFAFLRCQDYHWHCQLHLPYLPRSQKKEPSMNHMLPQPPHHSNRCNHPSHLIRVQILVQSRFRHRRVSCSCLACYLHQWNHQTLDVNESRAFWPCPHLNANCWREEGWCRSWIYVHISAVRGCCHWKKRITPVWIVSCWFWGGGGLLYCWQMLSRIMGTALIVASIQRNQLRELRYDMRISPMCSFPNYKQTEKRINNLFDASQSQACCI